jgi:hypothetical protein
MERTLDIDFSMSLLQTKLGIIVQRRNAVALNYWVYVDVFNGVPWAVIAVVMASLMGAFLLIPRSIREPLHPEVRLINLQVHQI